MSIIQVETLNLLTKEMLIGILNKKNNTSFSQADLSFEVCNKEISQDGKHDVHTFIVTHKDQETFPGSYIIKINTPAMVSSDLLPKVQPHFLISNELTDKLESNNNNYSDELISYISNMFDYRLEPQEESISFKPQIRKPLNTSKVGSLLTLSNELFIGYENTIQDEPHATFRYFRKPLTTNGNILNLEFFKITDDLEFTQRLISYFKQEWDEEWTNLDTGYGLGNCYHLIAYPITNSLYLRILLLPANGERPCGIVPIYDKLTNSNNEYDNVFYLSGTAPDGVTIFDKENNPFVKTMNLLSKLLVMNKIVLKEIIPNLNNNQYSETFNELNYSGIVLHLITKCFNHYLTTYQTENMGILSSNIYYSPFDEYWYATKINNPYLQLLVHNQIRFKTIGFDLSRLFKGKLFVKLTNDKNEPITLREAILNETGVLLPTEAEGLVVTKNDNNTYTLKVTKGIASFLFKKNSELVIGVK